MSHLNYRNYILLLAPALLLCACGSSGESAQGTAVVQEGNAPAPVASPQATQTGAAALQEFIDPVTGQPRAPTAAELRALEAAKQTTAPSSAISSKPRGKETVLPNGWVAVEVDSASEMKGCVQKDGRVVAGHDCKSDVAAPVAKP